MIDFIKTKMPNAEKIWKQVRCLIIVNVRVRPRYTKTDKNVGVHAMPGIRRIHISFDMR